MPGPIPDASALPASHVFFTAACGRRQRTIVVPRWAVAAAAVTFVFATFWSVGCTVYAVGHESLLATAMRRERDLQYGFEDRIALLQRQLERTTTEHAQLERSVGTRLDVLSAQGADLRRRADRVASLAQDMMRLASRTTPDPRRAASSAASVHQADDELDSAPHPAPPARGAAEKLSAVSGDFSKIEADQYRQLAGFQAAATDRIADYRAALAGAGLSLARYGHEAPAAGGPFVPLDPKTLPPGFERTSLALEGTLAEAARLHAAVARTPFNKPLAGDPEVTSPFGPRTDPFLGRPALHTGIDLREDIGTAVLATAPGRVVSAGPASGYGTMVELDHGAGLTTRYAHLSAVTVEVGQMVTLGTVIGRVGETGRATGPHLHYETRIDGEPVDPLHFLQAGARLAQSESR